jgi:mevalonate kinase
MGLGGSAALAVAIVRSLDLAVWLGLSAERVNALAFECEKAAHGTPSGVDNTVATYGQMCCCTATRRGRAFAAGVE